MKKEKSESAISSKRKKQKPVLIGLPRFNLFSANSLHRTNQHSNGVDKEYTDNCNHRMTEQGKNDIVNGEEKRSKSTLSSQETDLTVTEEIIVPTKSNLLYIGPLLSCGQSHHHGEIDDKELALLRYSSEGNLDALKKIFLEQSYYLFHFDVNCVDSLDRNALSLAILNGHLDVVEFLLSDEVSNLDPGEALFYAIESDFYDAIKLLLDKNPQTSLQIKPGTTSPFEPKLTPFMLAAHKNNYKILNMLYKYNHCLSQHAVVVGNDGDCFGWDAVMERLLYYKACASPAFMLLMYNEKGLEWDPLNKAMDLFEELQSKAKIEIEVDKIYRRLADQCETFAIELLQEVRSAHELADFMYYNLDDELNDDPETVSVVSFVKKKRADYLKPIGKAVKHKMKDFVTSDNAQLSLNYLQKGKMFRQIKGYKAILWKIFLGMMFPFLSLAFYLFPSTKVGSLLLNPTVRFMCWVMSEIVFLIILLLNTLLSYNDGQGKNIPIPPLLIAAYFWIVAKLVQEIREMHNQGLMQYLSNIWNWNDLVSIVCFTMFMVIRIIGSTAADLENLHQDTIHSIFFFSDLFIASAYILLHLRIMELLRVERSFGPLQVSLDLMMRDAIRFLVIFAIVFLAFGSGLSELYLPYSHKTKCSCNATTECNDTLKFVDNLSDQLNYTINDPSSKPPCLACSKTKDLSFFKIAPDLFWTMFGYAEPQELYTNKNCPEKYVFEQFMGGAIFGLYHIVAIIVLVNMLIAMMSNSFQKTYDDAEREWKFYSTELWLKYIRNEIVKPPPMNLLPRWKSIKRAFVILSLWLRRHIFFWCCNNCGFEEPLPGDKHSLELKKTSDASNSDPSVLESDKKYFNVLNLVAVRYIKKKVLHDEMVI